MKNTITEFQPKNILTGGFPVVTDSIAVKTTVESGDIVGLSAKKEYGKYDTATYTDIVGVAYDAIVAEGTGTVILTGELSAEFVSLPVSKEIETKNSLRKLSIFIK